MFCSLPQKHEGNSSVFCAQCSTAVHDKALRKYRTTLTRLYALHQAAVSKVGKGRCARLRRVIHGQLQTAVSELPPLPQRATGTASTSYNNDTFDVSALYAHSKASALRGSRLASTAGVNLLETTTVDVRADFTNVDQAAISNDDDAAEECRHRGFGGNGVHSAKQHDAVAEGKTTRKGAAANEVPAAAAGTMPPEMLTSAIRGCKHWSDVRKIWEAHGQQLNCIHMSASIWKLADLVPPAQQRQMTRPRRRALDLFVSTVIDRTQGVADTADFRTAANIAMGLAKLVPRVRFAQPAPNAAPLAEKASELVTFLLSSWRCRASSAQGGSSSSSSSNGTRNGGANSRRPGAKPVDYAQMLWAAAKFGVIPSAEWMQDFYRCSWPQLQLFKREELVITLYSLAVLKLHPEESWATALCDVMCTYLEEMSLQEIADVTWALARLQLSVFSSTSQAVISAASGKAARLHSNDPRSAASAVMLLIWGLGKLHARAVLENRPAPYVLSQKAEPAESAYAAAAAPATSAAGGLEEESERMGGMRNWRSVLEETGASLEVNGHSRNGVTPYESVSSGSPITASYASSTNAYYTSPPSEAGTVHQNSASSSSPTQNGTHRHRGQESWTGAPPSQTPPVSPALQAAAALFASASSSLNTTSHPTPMSTSTPNSTPSPSSNSNSINNGTHIMNGSQLRPGVTHDGDAAASKSNMFNGLSPPRVGASAGEVPSVHGSSSMAQGANGSTVVSGSDGSSSSAASGIAWGRSGSADAAGRDMGCDSDGLANAGTINARTSSASDVSCHPAGEEGTGTINATTSSSASDVSCHPAGQQDAGLVNVTSSSSASDVACHPAGQQDAGLVNVTSSPSASDVSCHPAEQQHAATENTTILTSDTSQATASHPKSPTQSLPAAPMPDAHQERVGEAARQLLASSSSGTASLRRPRLPFTISHPRVALSWQVARMNNGPNGNNIFSPDSSWEEGYECIFPSARSSQWKPDRSWIASVCRWSIPLLSHCQPRELAAVMHGWANLGVNPDPLWLDQFFSITPLHFQTLSVKEIATICWALGRLQERPPVTWMRRFLCEMAARRRHDYSRAEMLQIVWCLQQLRVASVHLFSPEAVMKLRTNRLVFHAFLQRLAHGKPKGRGGHAADRRQLQHSRR